MIGGLFDGPIVRFDVAETDVPLGFAGAMSGERQIMFTEQQSEMSAREGRVIFLGGFAQLVSLEDFRERGRQLGEKAAFLRDAPCILSGGWIGQCWTGGERRFLAWWHIAYSQSQFH